MLEAGWVMSDRADMARLAPVSGGGRAALMGNGGGAGAAAAAAPSVRRRWRHAMQAFWESD